MHTTKLVLNDKLKHSVNDPYLNDPKFSDIKVYANIADPDQTAPRGAV